jgi:AraC-like DNA-binding protein
VIRNRIDAGLPLHIGAVANELFVSKRTLQRGLADEGLVFGMVRREAQLLSALERMTKGASAARAARDVGLSRDHLCVLTRDRTGLTPRQIMRASELARRTAQWQRGVPPRYGTKLYFKRRYQWRRIDTELTRLLASIDAGHPLADWAIRLRRQARRPDYRRRRYRARVRAERRREEAAEAERRRESIRWVESALRAAAERACHESTMS